MNISIPIGVVSVGSTGKLPVFLAQTNAQPITHLQVGDKPGDGDIYSDLSEFMDAWGENFTPAMESPSGFYCKGCGDRGDCELECELCQ